MGADATSDGVSIGTLEQRDADRVAHHARILADDERHTAGTAENVTKTGAPWAPFRVFILRKVFGKSFSF